MRIPWNKGRLPGAKPPLRPRYLDIEVDDTIAIAEQVEI